MKKNDTIILALASLFTAARTTLAQQTSLQCHDPVMTRWMLNSAGETPCQVLQDVMQICNPSYAVDWLTPSYSCDNSPTAMTAACCCGSPTFALFSACCYDPIIRSRTDQVNIPLWAHMVPSAGRWDLTGVYCSPGSDKLSNTKCQHLILCSHHRHYCWFGPRNFPYVYPRSASFMGNNWARLSPEP
ncbi:hypothetical protein AG1IA_07267 [Rhizoctonia solani AG-1 IA]|uniref:Hydrophobin domain-containing protein n=1 Tax=Thanatephorus cucumeris (strain AG1-IA) TaxID=983506 RepID=L8WPK8_THACA|nr:hypothetical protein AG1IA_07267 [Rhizoctonia solani AG-1 IA]